MHTPDRARWRGSGPRGQWCCWGESASPSSSRAGHAGRAEVRHRAWRTHPPTPCAAPTPEEPRVRITLAQTDASLGDLDGNLKRVERVVAEAVDAGSDLVVFPELALSGYQVGDVPHDLSLAPDDPRLLRLSQRAGGAGVVLGVPQGGSPRPPTHNNA